MPAGNKDDYKYEKPREPEQPKTESEVNKSELWEQVQEIAKSKTIK